jgi:hypothetical protein
MNKEIEEILKRQFNFMHEYHCERTADILEMLKDNLGEEVLKVVEKAPVNKYGLYRWHLERLVALLDLLTESYGAEVLDLIVGLERSKAKEQGRRDAERLGANSLQDITSYFTGGDRDRIVKESENEVLIKNIGCLSGRIVAELGRVNLLYDLHCGLDNYYVEGFNKELGCEIIKTIMEGQECCLHRVFKK